jgi:hypothetical protein
MATIKPIESRSVQLPIQTALIAYHVRFIKSNPVRLLSICALL